MNFLPVPKLLKWAPGVPQQYTSKRSILLTSGCSFTASTLQTDFAASWPGFVLDRCGFDHCVDYSYPGIGNEYIGDSILHHLASVTNPKDYMVIVMWTGLDRIESKEKIKEQPLLGDVSYIRKPGRDPVNGVANSAKKIIEVQEYLESNNISYVFSTHCNLLFPPYSSKRFSFLFPKRDTTPEFDKHLDKDTLTQLKTLNWIPKTNDEFLYEFGARQDLLADDLFHPTNKCTDLWTDKVLLPQMCAGNLIEKL